MDFCDRFVVVGNCAVNSQRFIVAVVRRQDSNAIGRDSNSSTDNDSDSESIEWQTSAADAGHGIVADNRLGQHSLFAEDPFATVARSVSTRGPPVLIQTQIEVHVSNLRDGFLLFRAFVNERERRALDMLDVLLDKQRSSRQVHTVESETRRNNVRQEYQRVVDALIQRVLSHIQVLI
jgi:hypothetical protein